jgi:hypothetical protein
LACSTNDDDDGDNNREEEEEKNKTSFVLQNTISVSLSVARETDNK